jgi:hypothetical protein
MPLCLNPCVPLTITVPAVNTRIRDTPNLAKATQRIPRQKLTVKLYFPFHFNFSLSYSRKQSIYCPATTKEHL